MHRFLKRATHRFRIRWLRRSTQCDICFFCFYLTYPHPTQPSRGKARLLRQNLRTGAPLQHSPVEFPKRNQGLAGLATPAGSILLSASTGRNPWEIAKTMQKNEAQAGLTNSLHSFQDGTDQDSEVAKNGHRNGQSERAFPTVAKGYTFRTFHEACGMRKKKPDTIDSTPDSTQHTDEYMWILMNTGDTFEAKPLKGHCWHQSYCVQRKRHWYGGRWLAPRSRNLPKVWESWTLGHMETNKILVHLTWVCSGDSSCMKIHPKPTALLKKPSKHTYLSTIWKKKGACD